MVSVVLKLSNLENGKYHKRNDYQSYIVHEPRCGFRSYLSSVALFCFLSRASRFNKERKEELSRAGRTLRSDYPA